MRNFVLTSTSVTGGHPDKLCDRISDAIVDAYLTLDPAALVNAECGVASGIVFVAAHTVAGAHVDLPAIVRGVIAEAGYADADFNPSNVAVLATATPMAQVAGGIGRGQTPRAGAGIDPRRRGGGSDPVLRPRPGLVNATVFGHACRHTPEMLPLSIVLAHRLTRRLTEARLEGELAFLHPDGQAQVAVRYRDREAESIEGITLFSALTGGAELADVQGKLQEAIVAPVLDTLEVPLAPQALIAVNPADSGFGGGPTRHAGLTGRKNDIDLYGGYCRTGSAALSGKDPSRIDRTGAYLARYAAKNVVASGLAGECEVQVSYTMGRSAPVSVEIDTFGSAKVSEERILAALTGAIDFSADAADRAFHLNELPGRNGGRFFRQLAVFGHVGRRDLELPWERTDKADAIAGGV
jgi:S-adenosylmethionine synthetase